VRLPRLAGLLTGGALVFAGCAQNGAGQPLTYRGWHVRMSADSARSLALTQTGDELNCIPLVGSLFCLSGAIDKAPWISVEVKMTPDSQSVWSATVIRRLPPEFTTDSLRHWLVDAWGRPDSVSAHERREPMAVETVTWLGHWNRDFAYAYAMETSDPQLGRWLYVRIADRARLLEEEARLGLHAPSAEQFKP